MKIQLSFVGKKHLHGAFLLVGLLLLTLSCTVRSTTAYIKAPLPTASEKVLNVSASCLSTEKIIEEFKNNPVLKAEFSDQEKDSFEKTIEEIMTEEKLDCSTDTKGQYWKSIGDKLFEHHQGLLYKVKNEKEYEKEKLKSLDELKSRVGVGEGISVSYQQPGSLSLSTRTIPSEQEPGGSFANMKERAQAGIIDFAKEFAKTKEKKGTPEEETKSLLDMLSRPDEPRFAETRRIELTISTVLNSASIDDRFDYVTAYLSIPPLPGLTNGRISLEREFLRRFQIYTMARLKKNRKYFIPADIRRALDALKVRIEVVDPLKTEASSIQLGKLTSAEGLDMTVGQTAAESLKLTGVTGKVSATREDIIAKELDKRSFWIDPNRSLLRITQRGMQEATISGSISSSITLKIPKTNFYVMDIEMDKGKQKVNKVNKLKLKDIEQPLYAGVDAIGEVLGTVRVAKPFKYSIFKKEAHGVAYTVPEEPISLKLWRHDRQLCSLIFQELIPELADKKDGVRAFGIYSTLPEVKQAARFGDQENWGKFIETLKQKKLFLVRNLKKTDGKAFWYVILPCPFPSLEEHKEKIRETLDKAQDKGKACNELKDSYNQLKNKDIEIKTIIKGKAAASYPELRDIWLGEDIDGNIQPLNLDYKLLSEYTICECPKPFEYKGCKVD